MPHDIIDNRQSKRLDYILTTLPITERAQVMKDLAGFAKHPRGLQMR